MKGAHLVRIACIASALSFALACAGCGTPPNRLYGSVSEVYSLDFDTVKISLVGNFLVGEYVRNATGDFEFQRLVACHRPHIRKTP